MTDEQYMRLAILEAQKAGEKDEVPIGAIVVLKNQIIGKAHNQVELLNDSTAHAEILALTTAFQYLGSKYLPEATLYVTIEPCPMCAGALGWAQLQRVVYGAADNKRGYTQFSTEVLHPKTQVGYGVLAVECGDLMKKFFEKKR